MIPRRTRPDVNPATVRFAATLLLTLSASSGAAAQGVALLPAVGPAAEDDRRDVDAALRRALADVEELDLLAPMATRDNLMSLAEMGLVCLPEDVPCLVKLGLVSNVVWVLVPVVKKLAGRTIAVEIGVIDVGTAKRARTIEGKVSLDDDVALGNLARRAMGIVPTSMDTPPDRPPDVTPPAEGEGEGEGEHAAAPSPGVILAGVGGIVAGVSLVGVTVVELVYINAIAADKDTRRNIQPLGAVLWGTTVLGAVALGAGIYLLTEEPAP